MKINRILLGGIAVLTLLFTTVCIIPSSKITETLVNEAAKIPQLAETLSSQSTQEESSTESTPRSTVPVTSATQAEQASLVSCNGTNATWLGTQDYGLICLDEEGWHVFTKENTSLSSDWIKDIQICGDGRVYIVSSSGLDSTDGSSWLSYRDELGYTSIESLACGANGELWIAQYQAAQHFDGTSWVSYPANLFGTGEYVDQVKDIVVDNKGQAWLVTANSIAHFDGSQWTYYEEGKGLKENYYFENIAVDCENNIWASYTNGVLRFKNDTWEAIESSDLSQSKMITVSGKSCGVWVATYARGISFYNGKGWVNYDRKSSAISSEKIKAIAVDGQDRVWIGTEWGLNVFDGNMWTAYHMHNSDLTDNEVTVVAVAGNGPTLPGWYDKDKGKLSGQLIKDGNPLKDVTVEACTEFIGMIFTGSSPCADNPLRAEVKTDSQGFFTFTELPVGRYSLAFRLDDGNWMRLTNSFKIGDKEILVTEGGTTDTGKIDVIVE